MERRKGEYTELVQKKIPANSKEIAVAPFLLDERPVTNGDFLAFVREKYATDAALQKAWADPAATLDAVESMAKRGVRVLAIASS